MCIYVDTGIDMVIDVVRNMEIEMFALGICLMTTAILIQMTKAIKKR